MEPFALGGITGYNDNLVRDLPERIHKTFDEGPVLVDEEIFLLPVGAPGFPAD
jgi:hypothetical protein